MQKRARERGREGREKEREREREKWVRYLLMLVRAVNVPQ